MSENTKNIKAKTFCNKYSENDKTLFLKSVWEKEEYYIKWTNYI